MGFKEAEDHEYVCNVEQLNGKWTFSKGEILRV